MCLHVLLFFFDARFLGFLSRDKGQAEPFVGSQLHTPMRRTWWGVHVFWSAFWLVVLFAECTRTLDHV